jgi:pimeloyl-ACP methyl ester carboxylesterase
MANHTDDDGKPDERLVRLDDGEMHVVEDGRPSAPALLLIHGTAGSLAWWNPIVPALADTYRVIRVDLLDMGPSPDAKFPDGLLARLLLTRLPGPLLWGLRTGATIRKAMRTAFTRPVDIPDGIIEAAQSMTHRALRGAARAPLDYLGERSLPARLAALRIPGVVIFGADDRRWRSSSAAAYLAVPDIRIELLPGVGHTPMVEDPQATSALLLDVAAADRSTSCGPS